MSYETLFSPIKVGSVELPNRIVMTAMGVGVAETDGTPGEKWATYYEERAKGGAGLIITEITRVNESDGIAMPTQLSLGRDKSIEPLRKAIDRIHSHGTKIFIQLQHAGRQNVAGLSSWGLLELLGNVTPKVWDITRFVMENYGDKLDTEGLPDWAKQAYFHVMIPNVSPSRVPMDPTKTTSSIPQPTRALTLLEIKRLEKQFANAALRAKKAGADGVELHAAHGYLLQQFLSPETNRRHDMYGGSLKNRMRFLLNIIQNIQDLCGTDFPISVRLSVDEFYDTVGLPGRGICLDEGIEMAKELEKAGVSMINVSNGNYETTNTIIEPISYPEGWRAYFVKAVKDAVSIPVCGVGVIRTAAQAEAMLENGTQDLIGTGRPFLADPYWPLKAKEGREDEQQRCISCLACFQSMIPNMAVLAPIECSMNPKCCRETVYNETTLPKDGAGRTVVVIGAGPAGMTAARELAARDFDVTVFEKEAAAGGQLNIANKPPHKEKMNWAIHDLQTRAEAAGAKFRFGEEATLEMLKEMRPYAVLVAAGGMTGVPRKIPGADRETVMTAADALKNELKLEGNDIVVVGSGLTGLETAEYFAAQGNRLTVVEMLDKIGPGMYAQHYFDVVPLLSDQGTRFLPSSKVTGIEDGYVTVEDHNGAKIEPKADYVFFATGTRSVDAMVAEAQKVCDKVYAIGDADHTGTIRMATRSAMETVAQIH